MLLETLLLSPCFLPGKTSFKDSKTTLSVSEKLSEDEVLLFFHIDDKSNPCCKIRELFWQKQEGHSLCDLLVFYAKGSDKRTFCFVELKDNKKDFPRATEQVISTYQAFKDRLPPEFKTKFIAKAFIKCSNGSLPLEYRESLNKLDKANFADYEQDGDSTDFLKFLRGETTKLQKKRQRNKR